ncbi:formate dehydrogenase subunit delta [Methyloligella sp. 2.7D]|uniref:formate dehydrogenase subunit delta n=1 Tax=unclassified Methyloligella TaxID=2625955 RepID=UPI00157D9FFF|nr:formate dehydrogenase subunit delta [Methyloligella sp. GL2]QKP78052.1 formate dehydrogenase subunit delta [Methyloligella sp. GL2]
MSHSNVDRLVYMVNQIGDFFKYQPHEDAAEGIANHIKKFWDPRMRKQILEHLEAGGEGLEGPSRKAIEILRDMTQKAKSDA